MSNGNYQNRINPLGETIRTSARGTLMGNRGVIHNDNGEIIRFYRLKAWITCLLEFKGRKFKIMAPKRWTALFFLDEATAFAAGHRPCSECRREDFKKFKSFWIKGNPQYGFSMKTKIAEIDKVIHDERINSDGDKLTFEMSVSKIPDGTFVLVNSNPFLVFNSSLYEWSPDGYKSAIPITGVSKLSVLTPKSIVNAFRAGYVVSVFAGVADC